MTSNPISSISYNTEEFLVRRLNEWVEQHKIKCYQYIKHKGEDGDKDHIHFRIEPNKRLDPMDLNDMLVEYDPNNKKPLRSRPFRFSQEENWFLYVIHDPDYLKMKYGGGEKGEKLPYSDDDVKCSDNYDIEVMSIRAHAAMKHSAPALGIRLQQGVNPFDLVLEGENPHLVYLMNKTLYDTNFSQLKRAYDDLDLQFRHLQAAVTKAGFLIDIKKINGEEVWTLENPFSPPHE